MNYNNKTLDTKSKLIESIKQARNELDLMINGLSSNQMLTPNVQGNWSVKDIIAHITVWEQRSIEWIKTISKGKNPDIPLKGYTREDFDKLNEESYQKNKNRQIKEILSESNITFENLIDIVQDFPDDKLEQTFYSEGARKNTFKGKELIYWRSTHYKKHNQYIKNWIDKRIQSK